MVARQGGAGEIFAGPHMAANLYSYWSDLAVTGYDSPEIRSKILASGADDYLGKPFVAAVAATPPDGQRERRGT